VKLARAQELLRGIAGVIHVGSEEIVGGASAARVPVYKVDFVPPAGGDPERQRQLAMLKAEPLCALISEANTKALTRLLSSEPALVGLALAREVISGMTDRLVLHAGPPLVWDETTEELKGGVAAGVVLEGLAATAEAALVLVREGGTQLAPAVAHGAVVSGAGVITSSTPVWVIEDLAASPARRIVAPLIDANPLSIRYGVHAAEALARQHQLASVAAPALRRAVTAHGPLPLKPLVALALAMGDECHRRPVALSLLLLRALAPALVRTAGSQASQVLELISQSDELLAGVLLPAARAMLAAAEDVPFSSLVTCLVRNGTHFGLQLSSLPHRWFLGPAYPPTAGTGVEIAPSDCFPDAGDGSLLEAVGLGGLALAAAPFAAGLVGVPGPQALSLSLDMARICAGRSAQWLVPPFGIGVPVGIDICRVIELNVLPAITAALVQKPSGGRTGVGLSRPPWECFYAALPPLVEHCQAQLAARMSAPSAGGHPGASGV
jgi:hypothetical protein